MTSTSEPSADTDSEALVDPGDQQVESAAADHAPDPVLLASRDRAREALAEITDPGTIGADEGHEVHAEHVLSLFFECRLPGYPGWHWTATVARVGEDAEVSVLEVELLPGPGSVVAPDWVPWSERLAQYREAQARQAADEAAAAEAAAEELADEDEIDPEDDLLDNDFSDFDDEIDGVDIDEDDFDDLEDLDDDLDDSDEGDSEESEDGDPDAAVAEDSDDE